MGFTLKNLRLDGQDSSFPNTLLNQKAIEKAKEWEDVLQLVDGDLLVKWLHNASNPTVVIMVQ